MEYKELIKKEENDLQKLLSEYRDKLRDIKFKDANKQLKNVREIRVFKQVIAHILTILNSRKMEPQNKKVK